MKGEEVLVVLVLAIVSVTGLLEEYIDYSAPPSYKYEYSVIDPKTQDIKSQSEQRDGDETKGVYTVLQPDGRKRIVEYTANKNGADYKVRYEGQSKNYGSSIASCQGLGCLYRYY